MKIEEHYSRTTLFTERTTISWIVRTTIAQGTVIALYTPDGIFSNFEKFIEKNNVIEKLQALEQDSFVEIKHKTVCKNGKTYKNFYDVNVVEPNGIDEKIKLMKAELKKLKAEEEKLKAEIAE